MTFNTNGGVLPEDVSTTRECRVGIEIGELPLPTRQGYSFDKWYDDSSMTTEVTSETIAPDEDIEIIANWNPNHYSIRFNANGGVGDMDD